jgi:DNA polymerase, archaea type
MWILDSCYRDGVDLWVKEGRVRRIHEPYAPNFYLYLPDCIAHRELLEALEEGYRIEECTFRTIYRCLEGYRIYAGREVAEAIERQTRYAAQLYNVDIRPDQRFMAEGGLVPCGSPDESRFSAEIEIPLEELTITVQGNPHRDREVTCIGVSGDRVISGAERQVLSDLFTLIDDRDPDVILFPDAGIWMQLIRRKAEEYGLDVTISRSGTFRNLASRSYWSYGRVEYKAEASIPDGRILIDTLHSFTYREGGLSGILFASRLAGLSPNLAAHVTPGTLISSYEVYEAIRRGIAVPYRKSDAEHLRRFCELKTLDRGGMIFQPRPGIYEGVHQLDFTSLYPSLIVKFNLSPETLDHPEVRGFLPSVLEPLIALRHTTKAKKKEDAAYAPLDSILKWMLVTCFGYTGYKNAKFGRIEMHEQITRRAREILLLTKEIAEEMDFTVIHGIVDCLWVSGEGIVRLKERIEEETKLPSELETYDWIVFLPMSDGYGAYNRYFGRLSPGGMKERGIMARRGDTPEYVRRMQQEILAVMSAAENAISLATLEERAMSIYEEYLRRLVDADTSELVIRRRISRLDYDRNCLADSAVRAIGRLGAPLAPGMRIEYVVRDARRRLVDTATDADAFDIHYYRSLLEKAWNELAFAFCRAAS